MQQQHAPVTMLGQQAPSTTGASTGKKRRDKYKSILRDLGIAEVVMGTLSCVLCVITLITVSVMDGGGYFSYGSRISQGLWCGVFLITTGILGIKSNATMSMFNANMALSIITSVFMGVLVILSALAAVLSYVLLLMTLHILLAVIGFAGMVISIVHSAYCCAGVCCIARKYEGTVVYTPSQPMLQQIAPQPQHMMPLQLMNGQYVMVPQPPTQFPLASPAVMHQPIGTQPPQSQLASCGIQQMHNVVKVQDPQTQSPVENPPAYSATSRSQDPV